MKKETSVSINQNQSEYFQFPLTVDVFVDGKAQRQKIWVDAKSKNTFIFSATKAPDLVSINPDGVLLADIDENKTAEQYLTQYLGTKDFYGRYQAIQKISEMATKNDAATKALGAALKDPFFRVRIKALQGIDLGQPNMAKSLSTEVEKIANNDPKTLAQAAAITVLAKTNNPKYASIYEKGSTAVSNAVKGASILGISSLNPEKIAGSLAQIDLEDANEELINKLLPIIVKNKIEKQMPAIGQLVAFYPFLKFQDPELGKTAEEGFNWIMSSDNLKATESITKVLLQAKSQIPDNPQIKMMLSQMLKDGLNKKMEVLNNNPKSSTLHQQIDSINKAIEAYK